MTEHKEKEHTNIKGQYESAKQIKRREARRLLR